MSCTSAIKILLATEIASKSLIGLQWDVLCTIKELSRGRKKTFFSFGGRNRIPFPRPIITTQRNVQILFIDRVKKR